MIQGGQQTASPQPQSAVTVELPQSPFPIDRAIPALTHGSGQQVRSPASARGFSIHQLSPTTQPPLIWTGGQQSPTATGIASPNLNSQNVRPHTQSPRLTQSQASTAAPEIPNKLSYQAQEEPERLEVQPILISTELPLPLRSSQSVPHTPVTPSRLATHADTSPSQTVILEPRNLGKAEFVIPLCMQKRIVRQYVDTMSYYTKSITENMTKANLGNKCITNSNTLLSRLANVSTHIGLEGGGPSSQDSIKSEQEALYAELSSEKFKFLGCLFESTKQDNLHIALIAKPGPLHDIVELYLKGKKVNYNRPATFSRSDPRTAHGRLQVSLLASGQGEDNRIEVARKADLVIALDETFNAQDSQVIDLRNNTGRLAPVIRLIIFASVEHFDLCLPRTLDPIDRLRKLISCVWHTQSIVGELKDYEPGSQTCATTVATYLRGTNQSTWRLPKIQTIQLPAMDSDSSLSDAMSDVSIEIGRPSELAQRYWPCSVNDSRQIDVVQTHSEMLPNGKRPYVSNLTLYTLPFTNDQQDLDYGDTLDTQIKKQKMAQQAHAEPPLEEVNHRHYLIPHSLTDC